VASLDALRLAAGEGGREPVERQVVQADVVEELQALADLDEDFSAMPSSSGVNSRPPKKACASAMFMRTTSASVFDPTRTLERFRPQARAVASRALRISRGNG